MKYHPVYEIIINASLEDVWKLLENFDSYPSWNTMISFKGDPEVGKKIPMMVSIMGRTIRTPVKFLKIEYKPTKLFHLVIGTIFYILGALVAQQESLKNIWF